MGIAALVLNLISMVVGTLSGVFDYRHEGDFSEQLEHNITNIVEVMGTGNIFSVSLMCVRQAIGCVGMLIVAPIQMIISFFR